MGVSSGQVEQGTEADSPTRETLMADGLSNRVGGVMLLTACAFSTAIAAFLFWFEPARHVSIALTPITGGAVFSFGWTAP